MKISPSPVISTSESKQASATGEAWPALGLDRERRGTPPDYVVLDAKGQVPIRVRVHVMNVMGIDTVNQNFQCKIWIQLKWLREKVAPENKNKETEWCPEMEFLDNVDRLLFYQDYEDYTAVFVRYVVQGTFAERLELADFPLDHQPLHIKGGFWNAPCKIYVHADGDNPPVTRLFERPIRFFSGDRSCIYKENFIPGDSFRVAFFVWNIMLPVFLLVLLSFISFIMDENNITDRMSVTLTLVLALVAFKFIVSQYLPATSYLTKLDISTPRFNYVSGLTLTASWICINVYMVITITWHSYVSSSKSVEKVGDSVNEEGVRPLEELTATENIRQALREDNVAGLRDIRPCNLRDRACFSRDLAVSE
eukprot:gene9581-7506_t